VSFPALVELPVKTLDTIVTFVVPLETDPGAKEAPLKYEIMSGSSCAVDFGSISSLFNR
jgi:hypothetical protein